jgi:hypothetical protein
MALILTAAQLRELSDEELADLAWRVKAEQERRWRGGSWVEDIRQSLQRPSVCSYGYALSHPGLCQALF